MYAYAENTRLLGGCLHVVGLTPRAGEGTVGEIGQSAGETEQHQKDCKESSVRTLGRDGNFGSKENEENTSEQSSFLMSFLWICDQTSHLLIVQC